MEKIYPELVDKKDDGTLSVAYDRLNIIALSAIDELNARLKDLEDNF